MITANQPGMWPPACIIAVIPSNSLIVLTLPCAVSQLRRQGSARVVSLHSVPVAKALLRECLLQCRVWKQCAEVLWSKLLQQPRQPRRTVLPGKPNMRALWTAATSKSSRCGCMAARQLCHLYNGHVGVVCCCSTLGLCSLTSLSHVLFMTLIAQPASLNTSRLLHHVICCILHVVCTEAAKLTQFV